MSDTLLKMTCQHGTDTMKPCPLCIIEMNLDKIDPEVLIEMGRKVRAAITRREIPAQQVVIDYTNWKGVRRQRVLQVIPKSLRFDTTPHHQPCQWLFDGYDCEKDDRPLRTFALKNVHSWRPL
jgi:hypothetical protein